MAETIPDPMADLRDVVEGWRGFYRQYLTAGRGNADLALTKLMDLMMSSGVEEAAAGTLAMAVRMVQERGTDPQPSADAVMLEPIPGHPEFEDALDHMRDGLSLMVDHASAHISWGETDSENTACTYKILMLGQKLSRAEMAGFLSGAVTELAKMGWKP